MCCKENKSFIQKDKHITSYGLITYCVHNNEILYLSGVSRDSIPYREFIKGRISEEEIPKYIKNMTIHEIKRLTDYYISPKDYFKYLWDDLWINKNPSISNEYSYNKIIFEKNMELFKNEFLSYNEEKIHPRIFPKGRLKNYEEEESGALREFSEETNIDKNIIKIQKFPPLCEQYVGFDGNNYQNKYFLAKAQYMPKSKYIYRNSLRTKCISGEISEISWETFDSLYPKLSESKREILKTFNRQLLSLARKSSKPKKRRWSV